MFAPGLLDGIFLEEFRGTDRSSGRFEDRPEPSFF